MNIFLTLQKFKTLFRFSFKSKTLIEKSGIKNSIRVVVIIAALLTTSAGFLFASYRTNANVKAISPPAIEVSGTVTDSLGRPLSGVSVHVKGTQIGTVTDADGKFQLSVPDEQSLLLFTYVGFKNKEVSLNGRSEIEVTMQTSVSSLNQLVVVGYGTQKKKDLTAAVSSVKGDVIEKSPVANVASSLAGRVAGISMRPTGAQPGDDAPDIHVRGVATTGNNAPLIVVDGIIRNDMNLIDPNTIATVTVLKDAAAVAPYGLGGANGVILITTKKGEIGGPTLSLNAYYGFQTPTYFPNMLNAKDYMKLRNEAYLNENPSGTILPYDKNLIANYDRLHAQFPDKYPDADITSIMKKYVPIQKYNLQLSGGSERIKYYAGLGFFKQNGLFDPINFHRFNYNMRLEAQATNTTTVSLALIGAIEKSESLDPGGSTRQFFRSLYKFIPTASLTYSNGLPGSFASNAPGGILNAGYLNNNRNTLLTTLSIEQKLPFINGLSVKGTFSYDPSQQTTKGWHTPTYFYSLDTTTTPYSYPKHISGADNAGEPYIWLNQEYLKRQNFTYQLYLNYDNTFGKNHITGLIVAEARNNTYEDFSAYRSHFAVNIDELSMGSSDKSDFDNSGSSTTGSQIGLVYRVGYDFANKYLLEASGRYDGHYYFAPGKRWAYFPAFSAGWVLSEEQFFHIPFISYLKVRGSWGKSGNLAGSAFQYLNGYNLYGNAYAFGNGSMVQGSYIPQESNPDITWEIATKTDVGLDATLWNGLLTFGIDYFYEKRDGMLLPPAVSVPVEYGLSLADENAGIMENRGVEVTIESSHKFNNELQIGISGNFSYAKNKMIQVFETGATKNNPNRRRTGRPLGTQFGYHAIGLFTTADDKNDDGIINSEDGYNVVQFGDLHPGDIKYADLSGPDGKADGQINSDDETMIGHPLYPFITYGFTPTASWKGFDLSLFFQGSALSSLDIRGFQTIPFENNNSNGSYVYYNNRWTPDNQNAKYPRANQAPYNNNVQLSDFWMVGTGYLRLKTAVLGYTLPRSITESIKIQSVRIYLSGQNLLTISKLKWIDPEVWRDPDNDWSDRANAYPTQKVFTVGLNVTF